MLITNIGNFNSINNWRFQLNGNFSINSMAFAVLEAKNQTDLYRIDFMLQISQLPGLQAGPFTLLGSSTFDLTSQYGRYVDTTFADFEIGTYKLYYSDFSGAFTDGHNTSLIKSEQLNFLSIKS